MKQPARIAVVRVSRLAVPRAVIMPPMVPPPRPPRAPPSLRWMQDDAHHGGGDQEVNDEENRGHDLRRQLQHGGVPAPATTSGRCQGRRHPIDGPEAGGVQACAADQHAGDAGHGHDVARRSPASPSRRKGSPRRATAGQHRSRRPIAAWLSATSAGVGGAPGADRPDRLVRHHHRSALPASGQLPFSCPSSTSMVRPAARCASVSPMHSTTSKPAASPAAALARTRASVSPSPCRRSEWPTMTAVAPASFSIGAAIEPVKAPLASWWQSWPPTTRPVPATARATSAITVNGGKMPSVPVRRPGLLGYGAGQRQRLGTQPVHLPVPEHDRSGQSHLASAVP